MVHKLWGKEDSHVLVYKGIDARGGLHSAPEDAAIINQLQILLQRRQHRQGARRLRIGRPRWRRKRLGEEVGTPAADLERRACICADDGHDARNDGGIVSAIAQGQRARRLELAQRLRRGVHGGGGYGGAAIGATEQM